MPLSTLSECDAGAQTSPKPRVTCSTTRSGASRVSEVGFSALLTDRGAERGAEKVRHGGRAEADRSTAQGAPRRRPESNPTVAPVSSNAMLTSTVAVTIAGNPDIPNR